MLSSKMLLAEYKFDTCSAIIDYRDEVNSLLGLATRLTLPKELDKILGDGVRNALMG